MAKKKKVELTGFGKTVWFIVRIPYFLGKGIFKGSKKINKEVEKAKVKKKRSSMLAEYVPFSLLQKNRGDFSKWEKHIHKNDSVIGIILGSRGSGKSAFGIKLLENAYAKTKRKCFALGFNEKELPSWISVVDSVDKITNDAHVLVDEGGILFSSRKSMSKTNKLVSDLILIARHKNLSIHFISQNSSNLDVNILRQADYLALKKSSLLQKDFERKNIKELYGDLKEDFEKHDEHKGATYIHADQFQGFVSNSLPSFWSSNISKAFR